LFSLWLAVAIIALISGYGYDYLVYLRLPRLLRDYIYGLRVLFIRQRCDTYYLLLYMVWTKWSRRAVVCNSCNKFILIQRDRHMDSQRGDPTLFTLPRLPSQPSVVCMLYCYAFIKVKPWLLESFFRCLCYFNVDIPVPDVIVDCYIINIDHLSVGRSAGLVLDWLSMLLLVLMVTYSIKLF